MNENLRMRENQAISLRSRLRHGEVRDIRDDLFERLEAVKSEMAALRTKFEQDKRELEAKFANQYGRLSKKFSALDVLLEEESAESSNTVTPLSIDPKEFKLPLQEFIINSMITSGNKTKEEIRDLVERAGYVSEGETAGRAVHTTLLNLLKAKRVLQNNDGTYRVPLSAVMELLRNQKKGKVPPTAEIGGTKTKNSDLL